MLYELYALRLHSACSQIEENLPKGRGRDISEMSFFICNYNFFLSFKEIEEVIDYIGLELASTSSRYRKLVVAYGMSYETGAFFCSGRLVNIIIGTYVLDRSCRF